MKTIKYPNREDYKSLCKRTVLNKENLESLVKTVLKDVKKNGDEALFKYTKQFDKAILSSLEVSKSEITNAETLLKESLKKAIQTAKNNIEKFHESQREQENKIETTIGITCWRKSLPIEKVGLYIPGGTAPLFSTILMLAIPAKLAGCNEIILCTPPDKDGNIHPVILYTASLVGVTKICKVGGAQAIAGMAYGTKSVPKVYKIFGPGNQYVTKAKELIQQDGVAIDMPAGPSEVLVIADETCNPDFVAADLLSQAEHGTDSQSILVVNKEVLVQEVLACLTRQLNALPRKEIATKALENSAVILINSIEEALEFSNEYAPEHLIIASDNASRYIDKIKNAGSVFLGNYSCESMGDYASGTNHTLPTNGYAKNYSGVSLDSFIKKITFQEISPLGIKNLGEAVEIMATAEGLIAHKNAVSFRLQRLNKNQVLQPNRIVDEKI